MKPYPLHSTTEEVGLIEQVKVALDENVDSSPLAALGDVDTLTLDQIIESKVTDAARLVHENAAHHLLDNGNALGSSVMWESQPGYGAGKVNLPNDFMRLVSFRMSDWYRAVTDPITEDSPLYAMQSSRYAGVRGNPERPVVAIVHDASTQVLEFYSCQAGPGVQVAKARYIPLPMIEDGYIELCPKLVRAVVYRAASMTTSAVGNNDLAALLLATSNELAGIITTA
jgi:hypothetical protein